MILLLQTIPRDTSIHGLITAPVILNKFFVILLVHHEIYLEKILVLPKKITMTSRSLRITRLKMTKLKMTRLRMTQLKMVGLTMTKVAMTKLR